ncbi:unnamed protein product [Adineta ricciae]|uniref:Uncharacterized protein n=1 Tax=Adineta ricciae TaxID=249248 RepID=A0A816F857_ADIRI|nr:unnamed protein product [Adineta ricciae]CAF1660012.1 unnamed protein product [Adineta ricciae]
MGLDHLDLYLNETLQIPAQTQPIGSDGEFVGSSRKPNHRIPTGGSRCWKVLDSPEFRSIVIIPTFRTAYRNPVVRTPANSDGIPSDPIKSSYFSDVILYNPTRSASRIESPGEAKRRCTRIRKPPELKSATLIVFNTTYTQYFLYENVIEEEK